MQFKASNSADQNFLHDAQKAVQEVLEEKPSFLNIQENSFLKECEEVLANIKATHLIVLGIGGSALGVESVSQALKKTENISVLDNCDPEDFLEKTKNINWKETCVNVISKSGRTLETLTQMASIEVILKKECPETFQKQIICTTETDSVLFEHAVKNNYKTLPVPKAVGGRFSVFSPVGLFPLLFLGIDCKSFLKGAEIATKNTDIITQFVATQAQAFLKENKNISVLISYQKKLVKLWDWYRQLLAESIGKNHSTGITPVLAFGSTDQHSQFQLYNEGPKDKLIVFLDAPITTQTNKLEILGLNNLASLTDVQNASLQGTKESLKKHQVNFCEFNLNTVNEEEIGNFFMTKMIAITALAKIMKVNAFDQPGVEEGKIATRKILEK